MTSAVPLAAEPVLLRRYANGRCGTTAFFRNRAFLETFTTLLAALQRPTTRVLVHACSIGAEPYSLVMWWLHRAARQPWQQIEIVATDIEPAFTECARNGVYGEEILTGLASHERSWFDSSRDGLQIRADARALVELLPPMSVVDANPGGRFDAVLVLNAFAHLTPDQQHAAIRCMAGYTNVFLGLTAFHPDSVRDDLEAVGFIPVERNQEAIHRGWGPRVSTAVVPRESPDYSWRLPPYDPGVPDASYRFGSIFVRPESANRLGLVK